MKFRILILTVCLVSLSASAATVTLYEDLFTYGSTQTIQGGGTHNAPTSSGWDMYGTEGAGSNADSGYLWDFKAINNAGLVFTSTSTTNNHVTSFSTGLTDLTFTANVRKLNTPYEEAVLAVQVDNGSTTDWYVLDQNTVITATGTDWQTVSWVFDGDAAWASLSAAVETVPTVGSAIGTTLSGTVTGFGLLHDRRTNRLANNLQVDSFTVTAVPEPATMSLLALGGMAMLRRRKK